MQFFQLYNTPKNHANVLCLKGFTNNVYIDVLYLQIECSSSFDHWRDACKCSYVNLTWSKNFFF